MENLNKLIGERIAKLRKEKSYDTGNACGKIKYFRQTL